MRAAILGLVVFALGVATAALLSPRAGAHAVGGTISGSVGPGFSISMSTGSVVAGDYTINVSDTATAHNFHFFGPGVDKKTSVAAKESDSWSVTLQVGTYTFQCDAHAESMNGTLTVTDGSTTTTGTTTAPTTSTAPTTTTTTATTTTTTHTTTRRTTTQATTSEAATTTAAPTTTAETTTIATPTTTTAPQTTTAPRPLKARVASAKATPKAVTITVASNERGRAVAQLFSGSQKLAEARGTVPGKLVLHAAKPLTAGRYTLKLRVTAEGRTTTTFRVVTVA